MGLELSLARLKALAKFAFGMGFPQVLLVQPRGFFITIFADVTLLLGALVIVIT